MDISNTDTETSQPLTPAVFHLLLSLTEGARHGYGIMQSVLEDTGGTLRLGPGTLYGTLKRLLGAGWVEEADAPTQDADEADERRRYYRITDAGRRALNAEARRLTQAAFLIQSRRILPEGGNP